MEKLNFETPKENKFLFPQSEMIFRSENKCSAASDLEACNASMLD